MTLKSGFGIVALVCAIGVVTSAEERLGSEYAGIDVATIEHERQLNAEAEARQRLEMRQAAARAAAHAKMPSTMYASTPSDPHKTPHAMPGSDSRSDSIVELVMPPYLESVAREASRPLSQRVRHVLRTIQSVAQNRRDFAQDRVRFDHPVSTATALFTPETAWTDVHAVIPYFPSASDVSGRQGMLRLVNRSSHVGEVTIQAIDDRGTMAEALTFAIEGNSVFQLNSVELERGNAANGLSTGTGPGQGEWSLWLTSTVNLDAQAYIKAQDGYVTSVIETAPKIDGDVVVANLSEAIDGHTQDVLRLVNVNAEPAMVVISRFDELNRSRGELTVELPPRQAKTYSAHELATGAAPGLSGSLGKSPGDGQLSVRADPGVLVMSFSVSDAGHLTSLPSGTKSRAVPLFLAASDPYGRQGVLRVVNRESRSGKVRIQAFDDSGRDYEPITFVLDAVVRIEIDSNDLELGNSSTGLRGGIGRGVGHWRLQLSSELDLDVQSFVRTRDGLLTPMHATVSNVDNRHEVLMFKAVDDSKQVGLLRLINAGTETAHVTIQGVDDHGMNQGAVRLTVAPGVSRMLTATTLESGGEDVEGMLGDGAGEWRLTITSDAPIEIMNLLATPTGHLTNLSTAMSVAADEEETAESVFEMDISPIVQDKCINCHITGGQSQNTRLVFVGDDDDDHLTKNLAEFQSLLDEVDDGAEYILNKIQGVGHGGNVQVSAGTDEFLAMQRFLELLGEDVDKGPSVTVDTLFDGVSLESHRQTLRRAAIVFAGRVPTDEEYASLIDNDEESLRSAIRGLMQGPDFHDFLIRASNDRLLTDREVTVIDGAATDDFVDWSNLRYEKATSGATPSEVRQWENQFQYGFMRAPLELIAHVALNDLPYTEVLTADYIMANPFAARAYGAETEFTDPNDVFEFNPSEIASYYRDDESKVSEYSLEFGTRVIDPGNLSTVYPHAGILNTNAFLLRYPSTATNRNRARARWTYYHFLGVDVEKSASRTTDPVALADTNNPTFHNAACTVCHSVLDPVAGAFQNYGDEGLYRDQYGGLDSLDRHYKKGRTNPYVSLEVGAESTKNAPDIVSTTRKLPAGQQEIGLHIINDVGHSNIHVDYLAIRDESGEEVARVELETLGEGSRIWDGVSFEICCEVLIVPISVISTGTYTIEASTWLGYQSEEAKGKNGNLKMIFGGPFYRKGDSWYRDMRSPGFSSEIAPDAENSVQWLAARVVADERFADATVKFWWPALMGSDISEPPEDVEDADIEAKLLTANAQAQEVERLAREFETGFGDGKPYNLKDLLVELSLSSWFRANTLERSEALRTSILRKAGARRLLTPEELANKTVSLTGFQWGRHRDQLWRRPHEEKLASLTDPLREYGLLYGGIDSDGITERAKGLTSVMAGVAQTHATEISCPIVMRELFLLEDKKRLLFDDFDRRVTPTWEFGETFEISAASRDEIETLLVSGTLRRGEISVELAYLNDYWGGANMDRDILLDRLRILRGEEVVFELEMEDHAHPDCNHVEQGAFHLSGSGPECTLSIPANIPFDDTYTIEVTAWGDQAGDEAPRLTISAESDVTNSAGSIAIRSQLVDLYDKLLGLTATTESDEVGSAYELFVNVWQQNLASEHRHADFRHWQGVHCDWARDAYFLDGILDDAWLSLEDLSEGQEHRHGWDWEYIGEYFETVDFSDPQGVARTWVSVMTYLLMDYRYLYL